MAWCGNPKQGYGLPFNYLQGFKGKITATVGTAFNQTHPDGIEFLQKLKADLRVFKDDGALFHPKVYLFSSADSVALFIGSSNLTFSGFYANAEINVLMEGSETAQDGPRLEELRQQLKIWHGQPITSAIRLSRTRKPSAAGWITAGTRAISSLGCWRAIFAPVAGGTLHNLGPAQAD